jgi:2-oxoglutarate dehydrogenase complex dehydrogenase (E1) component-like enzyme
MQALRQSGLLEGATIRAEGAGDAGEVFGDAMKMMAMVRGYMAHGHLQATVDPLNLAEAFAEADLGAKYALPGEQSRALVEIEHYGFTTADLDKKFYVDVPMLGGLL